MRFMRGSFLYLYTALRTSFVLTRILTSTKICSPNESYFPYPLPMFRLHPWSELSPSVVGLARTMYNETSWNSMREHQSFDDLSHDERQAALEIGFYTSRPGTATLIIMIHTTGGRSLPTKASRSRRWAGLRTAGVRARAFHRLTPNARIG